MGKKKPTGAYNDFLDGEKLRDNAQVWTSLAGPSPGDVDPPPTRREDRAKGKASGRPPNKRQQLTHFLCLPLVDSESRPQLEKALAVFREEMEKEGVVPSEAVRPVGTLHLTLGVMALDEQALEDAGRCLEELDIEKLLRESTPPTPADAQAPTPDAALSIDLKGLVPMQAQHSTSILYAEPRDATARLYAFASALRAHFVRAGLLVLNNRPLILHATVVNTIYAKPKRRPGPAWKRPQRPVIGQHDDAHDLREAEIPPRDDDDDAENADETNETHDRAEGHGPNAKSSIKFDARSLIERYAEFGWAEGVALRRVQICKMGARKIFDGEGGIVDEEYEEVFGKEILGGGS